MMKISDAVVLALRDRGRAVVTDHQLFLTLRALYQVKTYEDQPIGVRKDTPAPGDLSRVLDELFAKGIIARDRDMPHDAYRVMIVPDEPAENILCTLDPLAYLSHLYAMHWHNLTDRTPAEIVLTRPERRLWQAQAADLARETFKGETIELRDPYLPKRINKFPPAIRGIGVIHHEVIRPGPSLSVRNLPLRLATVGRTFRDTLERPQWCGGMAHVLEVWEEHAETFLDDIIDAVSESDSAIVRVRAGYVLEERLGIQDDRLAAWSASAQRGGSRRLDPTKPYAPTFSEKWMISLNV
jgi:predicted transcriptional regulator of viral defense system